MSSFWDERYSKSEYAYGEAPNVFFEKQLNQLIPGTIILPCEGEGRNAIFASKKGWKVLAFDNSQSGKQKAEKLAEKYKTTIQYDIADADFIHYPDNSADVVAFIYAHFSPSIRSQVHQKAINWLRPGGKIILEAFDINQQKYTSGGPKDSRMLYTKNMIEDDFKSLKIIELNQKIIQLNEGLYHVGEASVIQYIGEKVYNLNI